MPSRPPSFGGLGLSRQTRRGLGNALSSGAPAVQDFLGSHKRAARRISNRASPEQQGRILEWANTGKDPFMMTNNGAPPVNPAPPAPTAPTPPGSPGATAPNWQQMVERFLAVPVPGGSAGMFAPYQMDTTGPAYANPDTYNAAYADYLNPDTYNATGTAADYTAQGPAEYDALGNYLTNNLSRLGGAGSLGPEYQRQADIYDAIQQREMEKGAAGLREAFGSRGNRYASDLTTAEGTFRRESAQDAAARNAELLNQLNQTRIGELGITTTGLQGVGQGRERIAEAGQQRGFQAAQQAQTLTAAEQAARARAREQATAQAQNLTAAERAARARAQELTLEQERARRQQTEEGNRTRAGTAYLDATNRAWQEYLMGRLPPQVLEAMLGYATTFSPPGSAVTT